MPFVISDDDYKAVAMFAACALSEESFSSPKKWVSFRELLDAPAVYSDMDMIVDLCGTESDKYTCTRVCEGQSHLFNISPTTKQLCGINLVYSTTHFSPKRLPFLARNNLMVIPLPNIPEVREACDQAQRTNHLVHVFMYDGIHTRTTYNRGAHAVVTFLGGHGDATSAMYVVLALVNSQEMADMAGSPTPIKPDVLFYGRRGGAILPGTEPYSNPPHMKENSIYFSDLHSGDGEEDDVDEGSEGLLDESAEDEEVEEVVPAKPAEPVKPSQPVVGEKRASSEVVAPTTTHFGLKRPRGGFKAIRSFATKMSSTPYWRAVVRGEMRDAERECGLLPIIARESKWFNGHAHDSKLELAWHVFMVLLGVKCTPEGITIRFDDDAMYTPDLYCPHVMGPDKKPAFIEIKGVIPPLDAFNKMQCGTDYLEVEGVMVVGSFGVPFAHHDGRTDGAECTMGSAPHMHHWGVDGKRTISALCWVHDDERGTYLDTVDDPVTDLRWAHPRILLAYRATMRIMQF